jgi:aspartate/methionine/tyrosine aminotransferase
MFADRLQEIAPFRVMELMERAKLLESRGERVVHFEVGEPDFETAPSIVSAGQRALADGQTKYTQALGIPALRERIADYYRQNAGVAVPPERIVVTSGASGGLLLLCALILNHEDELLMADPGYPCNEVFARLAGGRPVQLPTQAASGFQLTAGQVRDAWTERTRGLLLASPANPTGVMTGAQQLREVIAVCLGKQGLVILDEIYQGLVYGEVEYRTGLEISDELFVLNSFSKYFGMTGWRARSRRRRGDPAGSESVHITVKHRPVRGSGGIRRRGDGRARAAATDFSAAPRPARSGPAGSGAGDSGYPIGCVLSLCGYLQHGDELQRILLAADR